MKIAKKISIALLLAAPALQGMDQQIASYSSSIEFKRTYNSSDDSWLIKAYDNKINKMIGYIEYASGMHYDWEIECFHVSEDYQKQGIGTFLFTSAFKHIAEHKPKQIVIQVFTQPDRLGDLTCTYRKLCNKVQSFLPGSLEEEPESDHAIYMRYRVHDKRRCL